MLTMSHINDRMGEWKMSYSFENKKIDEHIQTYTVYQVDKMPDLFLEVEFSYPRSQSWKTLHIFKKTPEVYVQCIYNFLKTLY